MPKFLVFISLAFLLAHVHSKNILPNDYKPLQNGNMELRDKIQKLERADEETRKILSRMVSNAFYLISDSHPPHIVQFLTGGPDYFTCSKHMTFFCHEYIMTSSYSHLLVLYRTLLDFRKESWIPCIQVGGYFMLHNDKQ